MRIKMTFEGGESRYGDSTVNYLMPEPMDSDTQDALEVLGDDADELYEEFEVNEDSTECAGYDEMADRMAAKLKRMNVDLHCVEWWFGSEPDDIWPIMDELMSTLQVLQPRLYDGVMRKLRA